MIQAKARLEELDNSGGVLHKVRSGEKWKSLFQRPESNLLLTGPLQHLLFILISIFGMSSSCFMPFYNYTLTHYSPGEGLVQVKEGFVGVF